jgi:Glycosyl transferase family 2
MQATLPDREQRSALSADPVEVSVVMPCLNEAKTVAVCVRKAVNCLRELGVHGEVIVADNGSTDGSQELAREAGARVIHAERRGYGAALQAGIAAARGRFIIMGDADDSYDFTGLGPFIERLRGGDDLVMGNRFKGGIKPSAMPPLHRYFGNPLLTGILNLFFRTPIGDAQCGLRGFRKESFEKLNVTTPGMEFASEMVVRSSLWKQKISEVPTTLSPDGRGRPPHMRSFRDGWRNLRFMLMMCPVWLFRVPSVCLAGLGLALMILVTPGPFFVGGVGLDVHTMLLGSLFVVLGHQGLWLWAFAQEYATRTGVLPPHRLAPWFARTFTLERGLVVGGGLFAVGLALNLWLVFHWMGTGLGTLNVSSTLRPTLWGFTTLIAGAQIVFGSFFLSLMKFAEKQETPR